MKPTKTATLIVEHLRKLGPNARVAFIARNNPVMNDVTETGVIDSPAGLLGSYGNEFSGYKANRQLTHTGGGLVYLATIEYIAQSIMRGIQLSLVVFENINEDEYPQLQNDALMQLRILPCEWVRSTNGSYENVQKYHQNGN